MSSRFDIVKPSATFDISVTGLIQKPLLNIIAKCRVLDDKQLLHVFFVISGPWWLWLLMFW